MQLPLLPLLCVMTAVAGGRRFWHRFSRPWWTSWGHSPALASRWAQQGSGFRVQVWGMYRWIWIGGCPQQGSGFGGCRWMVDGGMGGGGMSQPGRGWAGKSLMERWVGHWLLSGSAGH